MEALQIKVTEYEVTVTGRPQKINAGNVEYIKCEFDLDEAFTGYTVRASFNGNYCLVENGECYAPILDEGECEIRVYGCILDRNVYETVISPKPTRIIVGKGSFNPDDVEASEIPATEIEQIERKLTGKQDKLTAGTGITIENNVISATGGGGSVDFDDTITQDETTGKYGIDFARIDDGRLEPSGRAVESETMNDIIDEIGSTVSRLERSKQNALTPAANMDIKGGIISGKTGRVPLTIPATGLDISGLASGAYDILNDGTLEINGDAISATHGGAIIKTAGRVLILVESGAYNLTSLSDRFANSRLVPSGEVETALSVKEDRRAVMEPDIPLTNFVIQKETDYIFRYFVNTMAFELDSLFTSGRSTLTFTTGDDPHITLDTDDMPEKWHGEEITTYEANTTYELDFRVVTLPVYDSVNDEVVQTPTLIIAGGAVTEASE